MLYQTQSIATHSCYSYPVTVHINYKSKPGKTSFQSSIQTSTTCRPTATTTTCCCTRLVAILLDMLAVALPYSNVQSYKLLESVVGVSLNVANIQIKCGDFSLFCTYSQLLVSWFFFTNFCKA